MGLGCLSKHDLPGQSQESVLKNTEDIMLYATQSYNIGARLFHLLWADLLLNIMLKSL